MIAPKLRFKADDGNDFPELEAKSLFDICEYRNKQSVGKNYVGTENMKQNFSGLESLDEETEMKGVCYCKGDTLMSNIRPYLRKTWKADREGVCSTDVLVFHPIDVASEYLHYLIASDKFISYVMTGAKGVKMPRGDKEHMMKFSIMVPSLPEQQKIADFLSTIDTIIEKQRATVSAWEERKKGVMQKLFGQEVRFKADDGSDFPDWEEKSFVNTFDSLNNSTFSRDCLNYENGSVKYIHYGDILVKYNSSVDVCDAIVPFVNEDLDCERFAILQDGDIVIADTAEDDTVGKVIEIENTSNVKTIAGLHTIACRPKEKFASKYLGYYMNSDEYHNQLRPYMQGIKVTSISKSNIALTKIMVPSLPEQQKIADCLSALDTVIQKQKETLEKWQELKKGLLQQMFV